MSASHRLLAVAGSVTGVVAVVGVVLWFVTDPSRPPKGSLPVQVCGSQQRSPGYHRVLWIVMENHSYGDTSKAPFTSQLADECGIAINYSAITHPSLPNYIAMTSGALQGFKEDCAPSKSCSVPATTRSLFGELEAGDGARWRSYEEAMPGTCDRNGAGLLSDAVGLVFSWYGHGRHDYAVRHNPAVYYGDVKHCDEADIALGPLDDSPLLHDLASKEPPAFALITPDLCDDTHNCNLNIGDRWLSAWVPAIVRSKAYRDGHLVLFITWDEGSGRRDCQRAVNETCHVTTVVVSPSTNHRTSDTRFTHYSLLRTTEELLGLPLLGEAKTAASMGQAFNLK